MGSYAKEIERRLNVVSGDILQITDDVRKAYETEELRAFAPFLVRLRAMAIEIGETENWVRELLPLSG